MQQFNENDLRSILQKKIVIMMGVMVRKPPYSFKCLVNDYKVRLNAYKIKR